MAWQEGGSQPWPQTPGPPTAHQPSRRFSGCPRFPAAVSAPEQASRRPRPRGRAGPRLSLPAGRADVPAAAALTLGEQGRAHGDEDDEQRVSEHGAHLALPSLHSHPPGAKRSSVRRREAKRLPWISGPPSTHRFLRLGGTLPLPGRSAPGACWESCAAAWIQRKPSSSLGWRRRRGVGLRLDLARVGVRAAEVSSRAGAGTGRFYCERSWVWLSCSSARPPSPPTRGWGDSPARAGGGVGRSASVGTCGTPRTPVFRCRAARPELGTRESVRRGPLASGTHVPARRETCTWVWLGF